MKTNDVLQADVMEEIKADPQLSKIHTQIGVSVKDGVVTISGAVDSYSLKVAAEKAVQRVQGVRVVASNIVVQPDSRHAKTDTEIADAIRNALEWNSAINEDKLEVKVEDGWVTLEGEVQWTYEKMSAQYNVEGLVGVRGITNNIRINTQVIDTHAIKTRILASFYRRAALDAHTITVDISGNRVTLKGTVTSWTEKESAEQIAWSSPGVLIVDNQINIDSEIYA